VFVAAAVKIMFAKAANMPAHACPLMTMEVYFIGRTPANPNVLLWNMEEAMFIMMTLRRVTAKKPSTPGVKLKDTCLPCTALLGTHKKHEPCAWTCVQ